MSENKNNIYLQKELLKIAIIVDVIMCKVKKNIDKGEKLFLQLVESNS